MSSSNSSGFLLPTLTRRQGRASSVSVQARSSEDLIAANTVRIIVGPDRKVWNLDKDYICSRSPYFDDAFNSHDYEEADTQVMILPNDDPVAFAKILSWMNDGKIDCSFCASKELVAEEDRKDAEELHELSWCKLWLQAARYGMSTLASNIIRNFLVCIRLRTRQHPDIYISKDTVKFVNEHVGKGTGLRALIAMEVAYYGMSTIGDQCFFARLAEYHKGDKDLEKEYLDAAERHNAGSHTCALGHWRVPIGCYYIESDVTKQGGVATSPIKAGYKYY